MVTEPSGRVKRLSCSRTGACCGSARPCTCTRSAPDRACARRWRKVHAIAASSPRWVPSPWSGATRGAIATASATPTWLSGCEQGAAAHLRPPPCRRRYRRQQCNERRAIGVVLGRENETSGFRCAWLPGGRCKKTALGNRQKTETSNPMHETSFGVGFRCLLSARRVS